MCEISRQSDNVFAFYSSFCKCAKRGRKIRRKKTKKLSQFLKSHISGMPEAISLKFGCGVLKLEGMYTAKFVLFHQGSTELRRCENCVFFLPVNSLVLDFKCLLLLPLDIYKVSRVVSTHFLKWSILKQPLKRPSCGTVAVLLP